MSKDQELANEFAKRLAGQKGKESTGGRTEARVQRGLGKPHNRASAPKTPSSGGRTEARVQRGLGKPHKKTT